MQKRVKILKAPLKKKGSRPSCKLLSGKNFNRPCFSHVCKSNFSTDA